MHFAIERAIEESLQCPGRDLPPMENAEYASLSVCRVPSAIADRSQARWERCVLRRFSKEIC